MHQETTINFHEDVSMTTQEQQTSDVRSKSTDYSQTGSSIMSSIKTRASSIYTDQIRRIQEEEERGLNTLNICFADYLNKIKNLGDININLRRQIEEEKQIDNKTSNSFEIEYNYLRQQLMNESQILISCQIRLQRANYDKKYYKNKVKLFSATDQIQIMKQQFDANLYELNLLKEQYEKQEKSLQVIKNHSRENILHRFIYFLQSYKYQYNEYMAKLIEYMNEYNNITAERIQIENDLFTIQEQLSFEREYNNQCKKEFEDLQKIEYDINNQFDETELEKIIQQIR
jgi:hypothetical protein